MSETALKMSVPKRASTRDLASPRGTHLALGCRSQDIHSFGGNRSVTPTLLRTLRQKRSPRHLDKGDIKTRQLRDSQSSGELAVILLYLVRLTWRMHVQMS